MFDEFDTLDGGLGQSGLSVNTVSRAHLLAAAKWSRFIGIVLLAFAGLNLVQLVIGGGQLAGSGVLTSLLGVGSFILLIIVIYIAFLFAFGLTLYQFGSKTIGAIGSENQASLAEGFKSLRIYFSIIGVLVALFVALMVFSLLFVLIQTI